jgi:hypothetical protein
MELHAPLAALALVGKLGTHFRPLEHGLVGGLRGGGLVGKKKIALPGLKVKTPPRRHTGRGTKACPAAT